MSRIFTYVVFSICLALWPALGRAGDPGWRLVETNGEVQVSGANGFIPAALSNEIAPGTELRTGPNGRAVIENNGDRITLSPNSVFDLPSQEQGAMAHVTQSVGTLLYDMVPRGVDRFRVDTPYLAAVIKGTVFTVSVTPEGSAVEVLRGIVQVTNPFGKSPTLVYPGQTATVLASAKTDVHLMGKAPASAPSSGNPAAAPQPSAPKSDTDAPAAAPSRADGLHIEQAVEPQPVTIGKLTNGLITNIETASAPGHVQAATLTDDGKADANRKGLAGGLVVNDTDANSGPGNDNAAFGSRNGAIGGTNAGIGAGLSNALSNVQRSGQGNAFGGGAGNMPGAGPGNAANSNGRPGTVLAADSPGNNAGGNNGNHGNGNNGNGVGNTGNGNSGNGNNGNGNSGNGNNGNGNSGNGKK